MMQLLSELFLFSIIMKSFNVLNIKVFKCTQNVIMHEMF